MSHFKAMINQKILIFERVSKSSHQGHPSQNINKRWHVEMCWGRAHLRCLLIVLTEDSISQRVEAFAH